MSDTQTAARDTARADAEARLDEVRAERDAVVLQAEEERANLDVPERDAGAAYFVLFRSLVVAAAARQTLHSASTRGAVCTADVHTVAVVLTPPDRRVLRPCIGASAALPPATRDEPGPRRCPGRRPRWQWAQHAF